MMVEQELMKVPLTHESMQMTHLTMACATNIDDSLKGKSEKSVRWRILLRAPLPLFLAALSDSNLHWHSRENGAAHKGTGIIYFLCIKSWV